MISFWKIFCYRAIDSAKMACVRAEKKFFRIFQNSKIDFAKKSSFKFKKKPIKTYKKLSNMKMKMKYWRIFSIIYNYVGIETCGGSKIVHLKQIL